MKKCLNSKGDLKPLALIMCGGALFSMHFGASSMVWPMSWGKESGSSVFTAFLGVLITALLLVVVGYIALARGKGTYLELTDRITGNKFGKIFTCITIAVNGPLYVIPRMSAAAWDSVAQAFGLQNAGKLPLIIFIVVFYTIVYFFLVKPGKVMDRISTILLPVLVLIVGAVVIKSFINPLGSMPEKAYEGSPFAYGFTSGYATGEILCALIFGAVIINSLKAKGIEEKGLTKNMIRVGLVGVGILTLTHFAHMYIGAHCAEAFPDLNYTALYTAVASAQYGTVGGILFCIALCMAATTSTIGMSSGCAEFLVDATDKKYSYKQIARVIVIISIILGCLGLTNILTFLGPILDGVYPPVIILVLYYGFCKNPESERNIRGAKYAFYMALAFGVLDMIWKYLVKFDIAKGLCDLYIKIPLAESSLAWMPWAAVAFIIGRFVIRGKKQ